MAEVKKNLSDYKEELHRCSKCGICQAACPLFQTSGNECTVSRGQFIMLNGVVKDKLKLNKNINKYLDLCLKCNRCTKLCPAEINALDIILAAKSDYFKHSFEGKIYGFLESKYVFGFALSLVEKIRKIFTRRYKQNIENPSAKAIYFGGCLNKLHPDVDNYVKELLNKMGIEVIDVDFDCCGMPFLTTGNMDRFIEVAKKNIEKLPDNFDYFLTDCASCNWAWTQYIKYIDDDKLKEKLSKIKTKSLYELIAEKNIKFRAIKHTTVTYHKPCHEDLDIQNDDNYIEKIIKNIENIDYNKMDGCDECCGFAGFEHPQTLGKIKPVFDKKKEAIKKSKSDYVLTSCAGCLISLGLLTGLRQKIRRLITFLKDKTEIL